MLKKIVNYINNNWKYLIKCIIILSFCLFFSLYNFGYQIFSPGGLINLEDRIIVSDGYKSEGSFNLTYVTSRLGTLPALILAYIIPSWDIVKSDNMKIEDESDKEVILRDQIYLKDTSYDAIIAAFSEANMPYEVTNKELTVTHVYKQANTDIKVNDIILSINDINVQNYKSLKNEISKYKENDNLNIKVLRNSKEIICYAKLFKEEDNILIGVSIVEMKTVKTNPEVSFVFKNSESGSSRGLMCAIDIYNKITSFDLTKGSTISGTGSIDEEGNIGTIDGVKYKLKGAVKNKSDVFIVPSDNYEEAINLKNKYNYDIEIIEAINFHDIITKLMNR